MVNGRPTAENLSVSRDPSREAIERLEVRFGPDAAQIVSDAVDDMDRVIDKMLGEVTEGADELE